MTHDRTFRRWICAVCAALSLGFAALDTVAREPGKLPNAMILATGGTIAGTGASSTATVGYTSATVGGARLIEAVPELKAVPKAKGEHVFQIASENMNNDY